MVTSLAVAPSGLPPETGEPGVAAVNRALSLLDAFSRDDGGLTLAQLARRTGLHKSTILRLTESLIAFDYLSRSNDGAFHVGPAPLRLGTIYMTHLHAEEEIMPVLRELTQKSQESAAFYVRAGNARLCAFRVRSPKAITDNVQQGELLPLSKGAGGLILLAFSGKSGKLYEAIRTKGLVYTRGQRDSETAAMACPVFGIGQRLEGALSISGPIHRFDAPAVAYISRLLIRAADSLPRTFGGTMPRFEADAAPLQIEA